MLPDVLTRPTARICFTDSGGSGRPVVFSHGAGLDHATFSSQSAALQRAGYRTILWDLRGHGESTMAAGARFAAADALDDLSALIDELDLTEPVLVGHSLGGNLSQALVRRDPARAAGLIAIDSTWNTGPLTRLERLALRAAAPTLALIPAKQLPGMMARASAVTPAAIRQAEATFAEMPKPDFLDVWRGVVSLIDPDPGYRTPIPLGLIRGARDRTGNIATAMPRWARAERAPEVVVPGAGHIVSLDAPEATTAALLDMLAELRLGPALD